MKVIGLSGVAGSGKDTFFSILENKINCHRVSLADKLKSETRDLCKNRYDIDPLNCTREEKEVIRPLLVAHAKLKRKAFNGRYWINQLQSTLDDLPSHIPVDTIIVITDIRYFDYEKDEVYWLKNELSGILVHISQYTSVPDPNEGAHVMDFHKPANSEEARNDPKLKAAADYVVEWPRIASDSQEELHNFLSPYVEKFVEWTKKR